MEHSVKDSPRWRKTAWPKFFLTGLLGCVIMEALKAKNFFLMIGELRGFEFKSNGVNLVKNRFMARSETEKEELWRTK
jgi:hypothetical protein